MSAASCLPVAWSNHGRTFPCLNAANEEKLICLHVTSAWRMGGDSNPGCLSAHTLSRRAQSTALSPIRWTDNHEIIETRYSFGVKVAIAGIIHRAAVECRCKIHRNQHTQRSPDRNAFYKQSP